MGLTSMQVCMDSSDWLQGTMYEENNGMDTSSSPSSGLEMLTCAMQQPEAIMHQRKLRPPHDQALNCPRCDSTHTKFCYYNNYSLTQPRYFCKTCRRYWTKGGNLRNIPVGGGCRKNKKVNPTKKPINDFNQDRNFPVNSVDFRTPVMNNGVFGLLGSQETTQMTMPIVDFMAGNNLGMMNNNTNHGLGQNWNGIGYSLDGMENYPRLMLPYHEGGFNVNNGGYEDVMDVKPNTKLLTLDNWQDHQNGLGLPWSGMINNGFVFLD